MPIALCAVHTDSHLSLPKHAANLLGEIGHGKIAQRKERTCTVPQLDNKVAVVTGSAQGIGKAIAELLARRCAHVVVADINIEKAQVTAQAIANSTGVRAIAVQTNVTDSASTQAMIDRTLEEFGRIDILVNNAGTTRDNLIMRMSDADWDLVLDINLKGAFNCSKAAVRPMMKQRYGRIINISSVSGLAGQAGQTNYSASKAGLIGFTKALAKEVGIARDHRQRRRARLRADRSDE